MTTFGQIIGSLRGGAAQDELNDKVQEVVEAAKEHRRAGSISLTLKISPNGDTVLVKDEIKAKVPEADRPSTMFFTDEHGNLLRRNPNQPEFDLREVKPAPAAAKDAINE